METLLLLTISLNILSNAWYYPTYQLPKPLGRLSMGYYNDTVYIFGGITNKQACEKSACCENSIYKWNMNNVSSEWNILNINTTQCFYSRIASAVSIDNLIYFIGVYNGSQSVNQVQIFDMEMEQFVINHLVPPTPNISWSGCVTTNNTHIFMVGGRDTNNDNNPIHSLQTFNIAAKQWDVTEIDGDHMNIGLYNQFCTVSNNYLYVFGGKNNSGISQNKIYKYDLFNDSWHYVGNLSTNCYDGWSAYSINHNKIYIVGRSHAEINEQSVHVFDISTETEIGKMPFRIPARCAPALIHNDSLIIFGGEFDGYLFSTFVQLASLPLLLTPSPTPSPIDILPDKTSDSGLGTGWVLLISCVNSIICIGLGYFIGHKCMNRYNNNINDNLQNWPLQQIENRNHGSIGNSFDSMSNSTTLPSHIM